MRRMSPKRSTEAATTRVGVAVGVGAAATAAKERPNKRATELKQSAIRWPTPPTSLPFFPHPIQVPSWERLHLLEGVHRQQSMRLVVGVVVGVGGSVGGT